MNDEYQYWLLILGLAIGAGLTWLALGRIPRREEDVSAEERIAEAAWISRTIAHSGGVAPAEVVEEVLDLHHRYLLAPPVDLRWEEEEFEGEFEEPLPEPDPEPARPLSVTRRDSSEVDLRQTG